MRVREATHLERVDEPPLSLARDRIASPGGCPVRPGRHSTRRCRRLRAVRRSGFPAHHHLPAGRHGARRFTGSAGRPHISISRRISTRSARELDHEDAGLDPPARRGDRRQRLAVSRIHDRDQADEVASDRVYPALFKVGADGLALYTPYLAGDPAEYESFVEPKLPSNMIAAAGAQREIGVFGMLGVDRYVYLGPSDYIRRHGAIFVVPPRSSGLDRRNGRGALRQCAEAL